uniref:Small ribosomal subunit protein uS4c n=1 Tax=Eleocharis cellulosa TaxID=110283 RepID=A0A6H1XHM8_9POAL|nr:ribosomal protein S4 [Eleocharis cellulosa]QJA15098.1 ribosomal protein S4 [Eleocharis cellulosa]
MSRYRGPRFKKIRRLRALPGLIQRKKYRKIKFRPLSAKIPFRKKKKPYRMRLEEKQRIRFHYGLTERQLVRYIHIAGKSKGSTGQVLLQLLEMRLDNILFRLGMASTIPEARQLVNHRHILVNDNIVDIPSYRCKPRDIISIKDNKRSFDLIKKSIASSAQKKLPKHLTFSKNFKGRVKKIIDRPDVGLQIDEFLVVEYYSRQI